MNDSLWPLSTADKIMIKLSKVSGTKMSPVKYPWEILDWVADVLGTLEKSIHQSLKKKATSVIEGKVIIEEGVKIFEGAKIVGPAYIGKETIIGNGALIREAIIAENCVVGYCTEIARSYIGPECWFHTNYVGDSVFEGNISMGSGAITANLRLDEAKINSVVNGEVTGSNRNKFGAIIGRGVRFGINAGTMPGIKIGANCFISSGVMLSKDLEDGSFVALKQELVIKKNRTSASMASRSEFHNKI